MTTFQDANDGQPSPMRLERHVPMIAWTGLFLIFEICALVVRAVL